MTLLRVEVGRALRRRLVWVLLALAVLGSVVAGVVAFVDAAGLDTRALRPDDEGHPALMAHWWVPGTGDGFLTMAAVLLPLGGLIGGATVAGAEWRAGTIVTLLTWEPRRLRVHGARVGAAGLCAAGLALLLQVVFLLAVVPAAVTRGSTAGVDGAWAISLLAAMVRIAALTGLAAAVGAALATLGRNTAAALAVAWGWMVIGENAVRAFEPDLGRFLLGENAAILLTWATPTGAEFHRPPELALLTLGVYTAALFGVAAWRFQRQDIVAA